MCWKGTADDVTSARTGVQKGSEPQKATVVSGFSPARPATQDTA